MIAIVDIRIVVDIPQAKRSDVIKRHVEEAIGGMDCIDMETLQIVLPEINKTIVED